ncbi:MAG: hypothetical protein IE933_03080 [Sphingomonadales bacterium]|nr:hypothetical protein [Sphingomonadales bacterium]MBD3774284.1 hypothetical protein [Paracoccaceae bacterium]
MAYDDETNERLWLAEFGRSITQDALEMADGLKTAEIAGMAECYLAILIDQPSRSRETLTLAQAGERLATKLITRKAQGSLVTGLPAIDEHSVALRGGSLIALAGSDRAISSALATTIATTLAHTLWQDRMKDRMPSESRGAAVAYFSLRLSADFIALSTLKQLTSQNGEHLMTLSTPEGRAALKAACHKFSALPLFLEEDAELSLMQMLARSRTLIRRHDTRLIVVDDIGLLRECQCDTYQANSKSRKLRQLKSMAELNNVAVIALCPQGDSNDMDQVPELLKFADEVWIAGPSNRSAPLRPNSGRLWEQEIAFTVVDPLFGASGRTSLKIDVDIGYACEMPKE